MSHLIYGDTNIRNEDSDFSKSSVTNNYIDPIYTTDLYKFDSFQFYSSNITSQQGTSFLNFINKPVPDSTNSELISYGYYSNIVNQTFYPSYWSLYLGKPGYQLWTVPKTGTYSVILCGAPGGTWLGSTTSTTGRAGGQGAVLAGSFNFDIDQKLIIQIGQTGTHWANTNPVQYEQPGRGGGGYSSIVDYKDISKPIAVAAGGGGVGWNVGGQNGKRSFYLVTNAVFDPSKCGKDTVGGSNVAGAGWLQSSFSNISANTWQTDCNGGSNGILFDQGGFGGGGPGGIINNISVKGGGGGGWIGGDASSNYNDGGLGGISFCEKSNVAVSPLWGSHCTTGQNYTYGFSPDQKSVLGGMCFIKYITPYYNNFTIRFTNCGKTGDTGPTMTDILNTYSSDSNIYKYLLPFPFAFKTGFQTWCVPYSCNYTITAAGASGGNCIVSSSTFYGGAGQVVSSNIWLNIGDIIIITVGQRGGDGNNSAGGGGGMTTVHRNGCGFGPTSNLSSTYTPLPLICAAGGAGATGTNNGGDGIYNVLTGSQYSSINGSSLSCGSGIYRSTGRAGTWDCQIDTNQAYITSSTSFGVPLYGGSSLVNIAGGYGGGGRGSTLNTYLSGGGGGFNGGNASGTSNIMSYAGNSYSYYTVTETSLNSNAHGYVIIKQN